MGRMRKPTDQKRVEAKGLGKQLWSELGHLGEFCIAWSEKSISIFKRKKKTP